MPLPATFTKKKQGTTLSQFEICHFLCLTTSASETRSVTTSTTSTAVTSLTTITTTTAININGNYNCSDTNNNNSNNKKTSSKLRTQTTLTTPTEIPNTLRNFQDIAQKKRRDKEKRKEKKTQNLLDENFISTILLSVLPRRVSGLGIIFLMRKNGSFSTFRKGIVR